MRRLNKSNNLKKLKFDPKSLKNGAFSVCWLTNIARERNFRYIIEVDKKEIEELRGRAKKGITPKRMQAILHNISIGVPIIHSCQAEGVLFGVFDNFYRAGKQQADGEVLPPTKYNKDAVKWYPLILEARAKAVQRNVGIVAKAAISDWKAAAWWLERAEKEHFSKVEQNVNIVVGQLDQRASDRLMEIFNLPDPQLPDDKPLEIEAQLEDDW